MTQVITTTNNEKSDVVMKKARTRMKSTSKEGDWKMSNRDAYVQKMKAKLDEWNATIDKLQAKADQAEAEAKIEHEKQLAGLRTKLKDVEKKVSEFEKAGESAWEDLKQGLENSWEILKAGFSKAKSEFDRSYQEGQTK